MNLTKLTNLVLVGTGFYFIYLSLKIQKEELKLKQSLNQEV